MNLFKPYYLAELKTKLIHNSILPKIDELFKEKNWNYILIGRSALHYYGLTTLSDRVELLIENHERLNIKETILNTNNLNSFEEFEGKYSFKYKKIRIIIYINQSTNINLIQFPLFSEVPMELNTSIRICSIDAFISLTMIQSKFDRSYIPLGCIELLLEKKGISFTTNLFQFPSIGVKITKNLFYI